MNNRITYITFSLITIIGVISIIWWLSKDPTQEFEISIPGKDKNNSSISNNIIINIGEFFESFGTNNTNSTENWPRFRGADFDNIYKSDIDLINKFPKEGINILWDLDLGEGHSGPAIFDGKVYILDYDEDIRADMLRCLNLKTGEELWRRWYKVNIKRNHGISRTVPAVNEDYILTIGPKCHVMCVDRKSGDFLWGLDIAKEFESEIPLWYTGQCPLIDDNVAIIATGGKALLIGVDCKTGKILWETPNPDEWKMSHASIMPYTFNDKRMYVYSGIGGICGVDAEKDTKGKLLWETSEWDHSVVSPSPVCMPDGKIFLTAGYGAGSMILQLSKADNSFIIDVIDEYKPIKGLASEQQTALFYDDHLFGIMPKDAGKLRNQFVCVSPTDCKKMVWTSGKTSRFGLGPYIIADNKFYLLDDNGTLYIIEATTNGYKEYDKLRLIKGHDAWAPMAIADGFLILRDSKKMICIDIKR